jgi:CheY-like chemotaxis protein
MIHILLADDDVDDQRLFNEALKDIPFSSELSTVYDGAQLMQLFADETIDLPDVLFLDLNMPRKNGLECLKEIKQNERLKKLPVIIYSTSLQSEIVNILYKDGANYYIQKPSGFIKLVATLEKALSLIISKANLQPNKENFIVQVS